MSRTVQASLTWNIHEEQLSQSSTEAAGEITSSAQHNQSKRVVTFLQNGQPSNSYNSMGLEGRFLKFFKLPATKAAVPSLTKAGAPAVATCSIKHSFSCSVQTLGALNHCAPKGRTAILWSGATSYLLLPAAFSSLYLLRVAFASAVCAPCAR